MGGGGENVERRNKGRGEEVVLRKRTHAVGCGGRRAPVGWLGVKQKIGKALGQGPSAQPSCGGLGVEKSLSREPTSGNIEPARRVRGLLVICQVLDKPWHERQESKASDLHERFANDAHSKAHTWPRAALIPELLNKGIRRRKGGDTLRGRQSTQENVVCQPASANEDPITKLNSVWCHLRHSEAQASAPSRDPESRPA